MSTNGPCALSSVSCYNPRPPAHFTLRALCSSGRFEKIENLLLVSLRFTMKFSRHKQLLRCLCLAVPCLVVVTLLNLIGHEDIADILFFLIIFGHDFKTAGPLIYGQRAGGGVKSAIKIIAYHSLSPSFSSLKIIISPSLTILTILIHVDSQFMVLG